MNNLIHDSLALLKDRKIPTPELDLRILLKQASYNNKDIILSSFNIDEINVEYFKFLVSKRLNREPISKIINKKFFWKDEFFVNQDVLDPRPESELIIEEVLKYTEDRNKNIQILDIGTGSGCLAISLAKEFQNSRITAIDISRKALKVAKKNLNLHKLNQQINLQIGNLESINSKFDIIISNPPYLSFSEYKNLPKDILNFEPKIALIGGVDGLDFYRLFSQKVENLMKKNSIFVTEIGYGQLESCINIFKQTNLVLKKVSKDIQKIDRTLTFYKI